MWCQVKSGSLPHLWVGGGGGGLGRWSFSGGLDVGGGNTWGVCTTPSPELFEALVGAVGRGWGRREGRGVRRVTDHA